MDKKNKISTENTARTASDIFVIGIGASAGGLQALDVLFENIPRDSVAYVIVQHLSPDHKSLLTQFLARHSELSIVEAQHKMPVQKNTVYVMPPGTQITIRQNILYLMERRQDLSMQRPVDSFFESLAADKGANAIGVILSGTGTDGSAGVTAIKKAGGLVLVQDPETAKFDGMPRQAIATGAVDFVLPPELMPEEIFNFVKITPLTQQVTEFITHENDQSFEEILRLVHDRTGIDFLHYKRPTIIRRISRRMAITNITRLTDYLDFLQLHPEEAETLSREFLIGVTKFFRDSEAFEVIERKVIPTLIEEKENNNQLRLWVAGCSSGEEAYSLAIMVREYLDKVRKQLDVKIFASDIDRDALDFAGRGLYAASSLTEVSPERLEQFFVKQDGKYRVSQTIRKMIIFAPHNIISDTAFSKIDLVSCRNMLIYLNPLLQKKVIGKFHYALQQGGYLFLGSSESIGDLKSFVEVSKKWKIFRNVEAAGALGMENFSTLISRKPASVLPVLGRSLGSRNTMQHTLTEVLNETILEEFGLAAVYIDENFDLLHGAGDYNKFLRLPDKALTLNLLKMVPPDLAANLGTLLRKVIHDKEKITVNGMQVRDNDLLRSMNVIIKPYLNDKKNLQEFILILFSEAKPRELTVQDPEEYWYEKNNEGSITELELELQHTKDDLQAVVEELETSNEELQSTNEELLSSNEELQSTNEELQSLNEELHTINAEHQYKIKVMMELDDDLNNYFRSTNISQIFLDHNLIIRKFTPAATQQINLIEGDIGRSIYQISDNLKTDTLIDDIRRVIAQATTIEKEVQDKDGIWYQMRILPYISHNRKIDGAIIIFVRIHELKNLQLLHTSVLDSSLNTIQTFNAVRNPQGQIIDFTWTMLNAKAEEFLERSEASLLGKRLRHEFPALISSSIFDQFVRVVETGVTLNIEEQQTFNGATYWLHLVAVKLNDGLVLTAEDITARKQAETKLQEQARQLYESAGKLRQLTEGMPQMIWTSLPDGYTNSYNQRWFAYTGLTLEQSLNWGWVQAIHPEEAAAVQQDYSEAMQTGRTFEKDVRIRRHDGAYRWHLNLSVPLRNEEGQITLWIGTASDIHEQKLATQELIESRHFIRQVAETSPDFIYVFDLLEENIIYLNRNLAQTLGYPAPDNELTALQFILFNLAHPDDIPLIKEQINQLRTAADDYVSDLTYRILDAENKVRYYRDRATVFKRDEEGKPTQIVGIAQDVTTTVQTQHKLITEKEFSESLLDNSIDGIVAFDTDSCITAWNTMMEVYNGKLKEEVIGKRIFDLFPEYEVNDEGKAIRKVLAGEKTVLHDHPYGLRDGYYETSNIPLFNEKGEVTGGLSIVHDITERKRLEDERINLRLNQQKEILNAILETQEAERRRISEALHNGLGQLLYATKLKVNDLQPHDAKDQNLQNSIDDLLDEAIKETRQLSFELMPSILQDFGLKAAIAEICKRVSFTKIQLQCEVIGLQERLGDVLETAIFRICQELLNNIIKHSQATEASIQLLNQKTNLVLRVEDNGLGFDLNKQDLTGLGLSSIKNRLALLDGTMDIETEPGKGSCFTIKIPKKKLS